MESFSYLDIVVIAVIGLLVIFLVLIGWQLIHQLMKFRPKKYQQIESVSHKQQDYSVVDEDEDEETRMIAVLMSLVLANDQQQDKSYCVTKIKRIR